MIKFTIPCDLGGNVGPYTLYIGDPEEERHPLHYQSKLLEDDKGGSVPQEVIQAIENITALAAKNEMRVDDFMLAIIEDSEAEASESEAHHEDEYHEEEVA